MPHLNETAVYKWATGKSKPSLEVIANLSVLFNVPINDLIELEKKNI